MVLYIIIVSTGPNLLPGEITVLESENRLEWESNNLIWTVTTESSL